MIPRRHVLWALLLAVSSGFLIYFLSLTSFYCHVIGSIRVKYLYIRFYTVVVTTDPFGSYIYIYIYSAMNIFLEFTCSFVII